MSAGDALNSAQFEGHPDFDKGHAQGYNDALDRRTTDEQAKKVRIRKKYDSPFVEGYHRGWNYGVNTRRWSK